MLPRGNGAELGPMPACSRFLAVFLASAVISADGLAASIVSYRAQVASSMSAPPAAPVAAPEADDSELVRRLEDAMDLAEARERYGEVGAPLMLVKVFSRQCKACQAIGPRYQKLASEFGSSVACYELEFEHVRHLAADLGIESLPCVQVYAGEHRMESIACGPQRFSQVREKLAPYLQCDPRSEEPCEINYDDELGPIPEYSIVTADGRLMPVTAPPPRPRVRTLQTDGDRRQVQLPSGRTTWVPL